MNKCPHCGFVNPSKVSICINCGKSMFSSAEREQKGAHTLYEEEILLKERYYLDKKNPEVSYFNYLWDFFLMVVLWGIVILIPCILGFGKYYILVYITAAFSIIFLLIEVMYLLLFDKTVGEFLFSRKIPFLRKWIFVIMLSFFPIFFTLILKMIFKVI